MAAVMPHPGQPSKRSAHAQAYKELKTWLRTQPVAERVKFLTELAQHNEPFSLRLTRSAQLPRSALIEVLRHSLIGSHSNAPLIVKCFESQLGKRRFWRIVAESVSPEAPMFQPLDYLGGNRLSRATRKRTPLKLSARSLGLYALALLVALLAFVAISAPAWFMADLTAYLSSGRVRLEKTEGGFWQGRAASLNYIFPDGSGRRFENFTWEILPGRLLRGKAAAHVTLADSGGAFDGIVGIGGTRPFVTELQATLPAAVTREIAPIMDIWKPGGTVRISAEKIALDPLQVVAPAKIQWAGATLTLSPVAPLGDYELRVTPDGDKLNLSLQTTSGALLVTGSGQYALRSGGEFRGHAQAAPGFADQLAPLLQIMGPASVDGGTNLLVKLPAFQ